MLDPDLCRAARARRLALELEAEKLAARPDTMRIMCIENGGDFTPPECHGNWGPGRCEIKLLGVFGSGDTEDFAIVNWIDAAKRAAAKPPQQTEQEESPRRKALRVLDKSTGHTDAQIKSACETILAQSRDMAHIAKAQAWLQAITNGR